MLGKSERRRIHGLILATLLHGGGPLLMVFLAERPTPTTRQVSSGGPPPQVLRDPGQPLLLLCWLLRTLLALLQPVIPRTAQVDRKLSVLQENPLRLFTTRLVGANWLTAPGPTNTDMVSGYRVQLLACGAAMNAYQAPRASTAGD